MERGTALYRVVREGFLEVVMFKLQMKNKTQLREGWRESFQTNGRYKQMSGTKKASGVFDVKEDQRDWDKRPVLEQEKQGEHGNHSLGKMSLES